MMPDHEPCEDVKKLAGELADIRKTFGPLPQVVTEAVGKIDSLALTQAAQCKTLEKLETMDDRREKEIRQLFSFQEGTKVYVEQILKELGTLKSDLFKLVIDLSTANKDERRDDRKESQKVLEKFLEFAKYVVGATIGALIVYLFTKGGA